MAAATFAVELKHETNADGTRSVRIRITRDRKKAYHNTGIRLVHDPNPRKSEWNEAADNDNWVRSKHPRFKRLNEEIRLALDGLIAVAKSHPQASAAEIRTLYESAPVEGEEQEEVRGLIPYIKELISRYENNERQAYADHYHTVLQSLLSFAGKDTSDERILSAAFISDYVSYLKKKRKKNNELRYRPKSIKMYVASLKKAYKAGVLEGRVLHAGDPFSGIDLHVPPAKQPRPAGDVILQLTELDLAANPAWFHARNLFVLQFLLHGGRIAEVIKLEWAHIDAGYVSYLPSKKAAKWKTVPRNEMIDRILSYYPEQGRFVFPYLEDSFSRLGKGEQYTELKRLGGHVYRALLALSKHYGLPRLTSHMARRAFTDTALESLSDIREVQHLVGWESVKTAERYADEMRREKLDNASESVFKSLRQKRGTPGEL